MTKIFLILFAGQSNMLGHARATDGTKPHNDAVFVWSNGGENGVWQRAALGASPFNEKPGEPNNIALHFADHLQRKTNGIIYLVGRPVNGSTLLSWLDSDSENMALFLDEVNTALAHAPWDEQQGIVADSFLWSQGESDDTQATMIKTPKHDNLLEYATGFGSMIECLEAHPWFSLSETNVIATELIDEGWLSARNDFFRNSAYWPNGVNMHVTSSVGLTHIGDQAHYDGESLAEVGRRMFEAHQLSGKKASDQ